jgi:hypothetical protein
MKECNNLFLETTIQISKIFGYPGTKRKKIKKVLGKYDNLITSYYVLKEFRFGFLRAAADFYNLLLDSESIGGALQRAQDKYWGRHPGKIIDVFSILINYYNNKPISKISLLNRLDLLIKYKLENKFFEDINNIIKKTGCVFGNSNFKLKKDKENKIWKYDFSCNKQNPNDCTIEPFLDKNFKKLEQIYDKYKERKESDKETARRVKVVGDLKNNRDVPYGRNCIYLSDWIICLEVPEKTKLFTLNDKHYKVPCDVLKIKLFTI